MSKYTKEINQEELKDVVSSSKSCRFDPVGCILESRFGKVSFDLSKFKSIEYCHLHIRRISGNGKVLVQAFESTSEITVLSKISQDFYVSTASANLDVSRPENGIGEVCILGITIGYNYQEEDTALNYNWKALIARCGKYSCLRMVDSRLFASEGAYIENASIIKTIQTAPDGMAFRDGDKIKFSGGCEITLLVVDNSYISPSDFQPYVHRDGPTPVVASPVNYLPPPVAVPSVDISLPQPDAAPRFASNIVYDSDVIRGLERSKLGPDNKFIKFINSNGKDYVVLKRNGIFSMPISTLVEKKEYIIVLSIKKISGNGKASVGFNVENEIPSYSPVIAENAFFDKYVTVSTGSQNFPGNSFKLNIAMLEDSSGELLISRILVIESVPKASRADVIKELTFSREPPLVLNYNRKDISVKNSTKEAAMIYADKYESPDAFDANFIFEPLTFRSRMWFGKSASMMKGVKVKDRKNLIYNVEKTNEEPSLVLGSLGSLKVAGRIFVEEWNVKNKPSEHDLNILSYCGTIITPSIVNLQVLRQLLPNKEIICLPKLWPVFDVKAKSSEKYFLYFEKNPQATDMLIDCWQSNYYKLYIVGSTKGLPGNMQHISEYESYEILLSYILGAAAIIDLSDNTNYMSSINTLAGYNNLKLITNNLFNLSSDYTNIKFLNSKIETNDLVLLDKHAVRGALDGVMNQGDVEEKSFKSDYNQVFKQNIMNLVGAQS